MRKHVLIAVIVVFLGSLLIPGFAVSDKPESAGKPEWVEKHKAEKEAEKAERKAEKDAEKAERKAEEEKDKAEKDAEKAERKAEKEQEKADQKDDDDD